MREMYPTHLTKEELAWRQLSQSESVRQQQSAFTCATGLPLTLLPANVTDASACEPTSGHPFCVEGCMGKRSGGLCLHTLAGAEQRAAQASQPVHFPCPSGLTKILVPVVIGGRHVGSLLAGPFSLDSLDAGKLRRLRQQLKKQHLDKRLQDLIESWRCSPVLTTEKGQAAETLLKMFAQYLSECGSRLLLSEPSQRPPLIEKVEALLAEKRDETVSLRDLAARVHVSPCYFCKLFKKQAGMTFTEYHTRTRIEKAKKLLLQPEHRVSEVAYEAGFESIPYFNRAFRRLVGCSPSEYRASGGRTIEGKTLTIQA